MFCVDEGQKDTVYHEQSIVKNHVVCQFVANLTFWVVLIPCSILSLSFFLFCLFGWLLLRKKQNKTATNQIR